MKLVYLAFIRLPTEKAHGAQIMKTCEAFAFENVDVELVIPGRKTPIKEDPFEYYGVKKKFTITNLKTPDWVNWGVVGFALSMLWYSETVKWKRCFWEADIIYSRDAFVLLQYVLLGRKLVYEAHTKPTRISTFVAKRAYKLIVISEGLKDVYITAGVSAGEIVVAHDAIDSEAFKKQYDQKESQEWLGLSTDKKVALYVGRIDEAKGADTFAATSKLVSEDTVCVLIGSGPIKERLAREYPKALFLPETPYRDLPRVLSAADVLVLPNSAKDEDASKYTSPLKAFAYLASNKPVIVSDVPALRAIFDRNNTFFEPDNTSALARALERGITNTAIGSRDIYAWRQRAQKILKELL